MRGRPTPGRGATTSAATAVVLAVAALALLLALRDERRLAAARTADSPRAALAAAVDAHSPVTLGRARAIEVRALLQAGRAADAELLARAELRRRPDDAFAARRLYEVQRRRGRSAAAAETLRRLRTLDPLFAAGLGG